MVGYAVEDLRKLVRGPVLCPGDNSYNTVRAIPNAMIDRRPAIIARCAGAADVIACVRFAREHDLLVSVRGGGHSVAGKSVCEGGLMIDLSLMKGIRVDPVRKTVRAQAGLTLGEFDRETQAFGLATTMGQAPPTGISGLTLGGGFGVLVGKYGLALDNLIGLDAVTADGRFLTANALENEDLFWGMRGSGGNLGIATSLEYRLHELTTVLGGALAFPITKAKEILRFYREFVRDVPDELEVQTGCFTPPGSDGGPVFIVAVCYCGPSLSEGEKLLQPLRKLGTPLIDMIQPMSYLKMQSLFENAFRPGLYTYVKSNFMDEVSDEAIEVMAECALAIPSRYTFAPVIEHWHGAVTRVGVTDTAFAHRNHPFNFMVWTTWEDPSDNEKNIEWTRQQWQAMLPHLAAGSYVNYASEEEDAFARSAYGPNYERLVALKNKYDPTNFFRMNHNIKPSKVAQAALSD
jgi:hypothetical protein